MKIECRKMCHTFKLVLNKKKYNIFFTFFKAFFSTLPSTQTIKVIDLIFFFNELALKNWPINMHFKFQPYNYSLRPFSKGGGVGRPPQAIHRFRPPSLYRVEFKNLRLIHFVQSSLKSHSLWVTMNPLDLSRDQT